MNEFKVTISGQGADNRIVTSPDLPQPPVLIEQRNGRRVTVDTSRALEFGTVDPAGDGEACELVRWLWENAGSRGNVEAKWTGWQAAAWIATNNLVVVARLAGLIEFTGQHGSRATLHARTVEACLRWEISDKHCRCGVDRDGFCLCLDEAFGKLNSALRNGDLVELGQQSLGPVNRENARVMLFASRTVRARMAFLIVGNPTVTTLRDGAQLIDSSSLLELVKTLEITSARRLYREQRTRWPDCARSRPAIDRWWREEINLAGKPGPKKPQA